MPHLPSPGVGSSVHNAIETYIHQQLASLLHPMDVNTSEAGATMSDRRTEGDGCAKKSEPSASGSVANQTATTTDNAKKTADLAALSPSTQSRTQATVTEAKGGKSVNNSSSSNGSGGKTLLSLLSLAGKPKTEQTSSTSSKVASSSVVGSVDNVARERELTIQQLTSQCRSLQDALAALQTSHDSLQFEVDEQRTQLEALKEELTKKDKETQEMLLQSYDKGKQAALFERQQLLEELTGYTEGSGGARAGGKSNSKKTPSGLTVPELLYKLQTTQADLDRWQSIACEKTYSDGEKPDTEPEIVLHFLRDSMYHYLTDPRTADQHFNAIIGMLGFTDEQLKKIESVKDKDHHHHR